MSDPNIPVMPTAPVDSPLSGNVTPQKEQVEEIGGRGGLDPTRYSDWEKDGRCVDF